MKKGLGLAALVALLLAALLLKDELLVPPDVPDAPAPGEFDANRAAARLAFILGDQRPHPVDSAENDAVRERLMAQMRAVGLTPRVTDDFACNSGWRRTIACARVRNVTATIGPSEGKHLLLSAHYDSTFAGPGAADAGIGIASMLETAALLRGNELRRPVTFLFNEGEEAGLIGARAFLERDPLAKEVDSLINLEARGVTGPAIMFETSRPNAPAIAHFSRAAERPVANSLTTDFYSLIPNSTDVAVFDSEDWTILNFAVIGNESRYHTPGDTIAALDRNSLQHMGVQTLALTRSLAAAGPVEAEGTRLYADVLGRQLVVLPLAAGLVLLGLLLAFFAVAAWRLGGFWRSLATFSAVLAGAAAIAWFGAWELGFVRGGAWWRGMPWVAHLAVYASALAAVTIALATIGRLVPPERLRAAFWLLFLAAGAAISLIAPGGAIFFLFPPLLAAVGIAAARRFPAAGRIGGIAAALLLYLSFGPSLGLMEELLSNGAVWIFAPVGAVLLLPFLIETKPLLYGARMRPLLGGLAVLVLAGWTATALAPAYTEERKQRFIVEYSWDAEAEEGRWAVRNDSAPLPAAFSRLGSWERGEVPYSRIGRWIADAPDIPVPPPAVEIVSRRPVDGGRRIVVRIATNGAESVSLVAPPNAPLRAGGAPGSLRPFGEGENRPSLICTGRRCDGAEFILLTEGAEPVDFTIVGMHPRLPDQAEPLLRARPGRAHPQYGPDATYAVGRTRI